VLSEASIADPFVDGHGEQDDADGRGFKAPARRGMLSNADVPIAGINVAMDAMPPL